MNVSSEVTNFQNNLNDGTQKVLTEISGAN